jgi:predicted tellurium resistance membrane protein TerC
MSLKKFIHNYSGLLKLILFVLFSVGFILSAMQLEQNWIYLILAPIFLLGLIVTTAIMLRS